MSSLIISDAPDAFSFPLIADGQVATLWSGPGEEEAVRLALTSSAADIECMSGTRPMLADADSPPTGPLVMVGEMGRSQQLATLCDAGKLPELERMAGQWESFLIHVVENPFPGHECALVIAGSDRRGTVYGIYELSRLLGVSPWHWWAGVPLQPRQSIYLSGSVRGGEPSVRYRGIFINDEIFGLAPWAKKTFEPEQPLLGPRLYAKVAELLLRLKANLLIPAMKKKCGPFNAIPENRQVVEAHGIVVGSAHSEPLAMSTFDWDSETMGPWDYQANGPKMLDFLEQRVAAVRECESLYSIGLRGVDDHKMAGGLTPLQQVGVLGEVIGKQREILARQHARAAAEIPQVLWLYKEVLENYDLGLEVPEDVTLIWTDDNYGYIRRLPGVIDRERPGGHGVYYHLSYLGRPFDNLWLSGTDPALMTIELQKARAFGADRVWIFNVGDIKGVEYELTLAMDLAWNTSSVREATVEDYAGRFFAETFGEDVAAAMGHVRNACSRLRSIRNPEHMGWERIEQKRLPVEAEISWVHDREAERLLEDYERLETESRAIMESLPEGDARDAYLHLFHYRVAGSHRMTRKWLMLSRYVWHRRQGRASARESRDQAWEAFEAIWNLTDAYMEAHNGKWRHWMGLFAHDTYGEPRYREPDQEKRWIRPDPFEPLDVPPELPSEAEMGVWCENEDERVGLGRTGHCLPCLSPSAPTAFFEIYNRGTTAFQWKMTDVPAWLEVSASSGQCGPDTRIEARLRDRASLPRDREICGNLIVQGAGTSIIIHVPVYLPSAAGAENPAQENRGSIRLPATAFADRRETSEYQWEIIPAPGPSGKAVRISRVDAPALEGEWRVKEDNPYLEYRFTTVNRGWFEVAINVLPNFPANRERGSRYAVSVNDGPELLVDSSTHHRDEVWMRGVEYNTTRQSTRHFIREPGEQILRLYLIDTTLCFQQIEIGPGVPETPWRAL